METPQPCTLPLEPPQRAAWARNLATTILVLLGCSSCSPYPYSESSTTLDTQINKLAVSYNTATQKIRSEQHATLRLDWLNTRPDLSFGPGCEPAGNLAISCDVIETSQLAKAQAAASNSLNTTSSPTQPPKPYEDICQSDTEKGTAPTKQAVEKLVPLQRVAVFKSLGSYGAALVAITRAQDRADFDAAAGKVSAAVSTLVQTAAVASGEGAAAAPAAGAVAKASTDALLWIVGQSLDWQRWQELRRATAAACEPVHSLAVAIRFMLEEQRDVELRTLRQQLTLHLLAASQLRLSKANDQAYGDAIDHAFAAADAYQAVRMPDPKAVAQSLRDAHDELVVAIRNNTGQFDALIASLGAFAKNVDQLETASQAVSAPNSSQSAAKTK